MRFKICLVMPQSTPPNATRFDPETLRKIAQVAADVYSLAKRGGVVNTPSNRPVQRL